VQASLGWQANYLIATIYVGIVLLIIFFKLPETKLVESHNTFSFSKILRDYKTIFTHGQFIKASLCYTLAFSGLIVYFQKSSLLLMEGLSLSPLQYSEASMVVAVCYFIGGYAVTKLVHTIGTHYLLLVGILLLIISGSVMWLWNFYMDSSVMSILLPVGLYVIGARIVIPNALSQAFDKLRHLGGSTSAVLGCIQMSGAAAVSYTLARSSDISSLPLATAFTVLGLLALATFSLLIVPKAIDAVLT
jgi:Na+/melibiose symporter-like transporter